MSLKLTVGNSMSQLEGLTNGQLAEVKKLLSYVPDSGSYYTGRAPIRRYLIDKRGSFPTGLLNLIYAWIEKAKAQVTHCDLRHPPTRSIILKVQSNTPTLYPDQSEAVTAAVAYHRGCISMPTGTGKSLTMAALIKQLSVRTLVIVPNLGLKQQLLQTFKEIFGDTYERDLRVENIDSSNLPNAKDYDCLIIDEAHHAAASTYRKLNQKAWAGIYYRYFFTATPFRSRTEETILMESVTGQVIYQLPYRRAVEAGYIVPVEAYYVDVPEKPIEGYTWGQVYNELVVNNSALNSIIATLMDRLKDTPTLCLVKEIAHGKALSALTGALFVNGEDGNSRIGVLEFNLQERKALIGTTGVLGEGIDSRPAEFIIIAGLGKSKNSFLQQVGRGVRKYPGKESCKVIIFKHSYHRWGLSHFKEQCKFLKEYYGVKPVMIEV